MTVILLLFFAVIIIGQKLIVYSDAYSLDDFKEDLGNAWNDLKDAVSGNGGGNSEVLLEMVQEVI